MDECEFKDECDYDTDGLCPMEFEYPVEPEFCRHRKFAILVVNRWIEKGRRKVMMIGAKAHLSPHIHSKEFLKGLDCAKVNADTFLRALKMEVE